MTITLTPDMESQVRSVAEMYGVSPEEAFTMLLDQALTKAEANFATVVVNEGKVQQQ